MDPTAIFTELRPLLFGIAYRMLGTVSDAEDAVQDTWMRWQAAQGAEAVRSPRAYLGSVVTRLCIDRLREQAVRREHYLGDWLPEPLLTEATPLASEQVQQSESLRMGFLVLLQRLNPVERAVFLLREVFDYDYPEIAAILGKSEANCRQILVRARAHVAAGQPRQAVSPQEEDRVAFEFLSALAARDPARVAGLLAADAVAYSDGGGRVNAARKPIHGADRVARFFEGLMKKGAAQAETRMVRINNEPGVLIYLGGQLNSALTVQIADGQVQALHWVLNPDKLRHLPPVPGP